MIITLPDRTPSLNQWQRWHWAKRARYKKRLAFEVATIACGQRLDPVPRFVRITRHSPRKLDQDNLAGGCKALVDALVKAELLVDDSCDWVVLEYCQAPGQGMTVEIQPLDLIEDTD